VGLLDLLRVEADEVIVPDLVSNEIRAYGATDLTVRAIQTATWLQLVFAPTVPAAIASWDLGDGESSVLALALGESGVEVVLDDLPACRRAAQLGLTVRGTLGIVVLARQHGVILAARTVLKRWPKIFAPSIRLLGLMRKAGEWVHRLVESTRRFACGYCALRVHHRSDVCKPKDAAMGIDKKLTEVYGTSRDIPLTYTVRETVDNRFLNDIARDKHIVVHGSSKQGKTCLRKHHLHDADYVVVQCTRESSKASLYEMILKMAGIHSTVTEERTVKGSVKVNVKISGEGGIPFIAKGKGEGGVDLAGERDKHTTGQSFEIDIEDPNDISRVLAVAQFKNFIVIEDYHYLDEEVQRSLAIALKVFHEISPLIFIVVGVWLEANKLILFNGDLAGRIATIDADKWSHDELLLVIRAGETLLNIDIPAEVEDAIINASQGNVGLLQELCYRVCEKYDIWRTLSQIQRVGSVPDVELISRSIADEQAARYTNFLARFAEGYSETLMDMYRWIAFVVVQSGAEALRRGLRPNTIFQRIKDRHPASTLQQSNVTQALERVGKLQFKHKVQPLVFDYSNNELRVVDASFLVFIQTHTAEELLGYIGWKEGELPGSGLPMEPLWSREPDETEE
jgi:predicted nucleic acid-binding protein